MAQPIPDSNAIFLMLIPLSDYKPQSIVVGPPVATMFLSTVTVMPWPVGSLVKLALSLVHDRPALDVVRLSRRQTGDAGGPPWPRPGGEQITNQFVPNRVAKSLSGVL